MKLYVVVANNHDYYTVYQWAVGVFTDYEKAQTAGEADKERYAKRHAKLYGGLKSRMSYNFEITEVTLNEILVKT